MTKHQQDLRSNFWKFTIFHVTNKRVFLAILGAYYLTIPDVDVQGIGIILLAGNFAGFLFELPSGYIADKIGHKQTLILSRVSLFFSTLAFLLADHIGYLIAGAILFSIGMAFNSGAGSAFMYETLRELKREREYAKVLGYISSVSMFIALTLAAFVPFLVEVSYKAPFMVGLVIDLIGFVAAISLVAPHGAQEQIRKAQLSDFGQVIQDARRNNFFIFASLSGLIAGVAFGAEGYRAAYQAFLEVPIAWFGVFFAIGRLLTVALLFSSGKIRANMTIYTFYGLQLALYGVLLLLLTMFSSPWVVVIVFTLIVGLQWGFLKVDESYLLDLVRHSRYKVTLMSFQAMMGSIVGAVAGYGTGYVIQLFTYQDGFLALFISFLVVSVPIFLYLLLTRRKIAHL